MKKQFNNLEMEDESEILSRQINPEEAYILGFLNEFNRDAMKEWMNQGYWNVEYNYRF